MILFLKYPHVWLIKRKWKNLDNKQKTIYLHIGMPKTGSTSIQLFLYNNRELLEKQGIFYPVITNNNDKTNARFINFRQIILNFGNEINKNKFKNYNKFFEKYYLPLIEKTDCEKIILSEEAIWRNNDFIPNICNIMLKHGLEDQAK